MNLCRRPISSGARLLVAFVLLILPGVLLGGEGYDGKWLTTVSCESARDALGYSFRFVSEVKDGNLRGLHGAEGQPSSLLIEGKIDADGTAKLYATGRTGSKEYVPGRDTPRGPNTVTASRRTSKARRERAIGSRGVLVLSV